MRRTFHDQQSFSAEAFRDLVWPEIGLMCGGGRLKMIEGGQSSEADMDVRGGIDAYQICSDGVGIRTITQRTERIDSYEKPRNMTIRSCLSSGVATEYQKRMAAVECGYTLPALTVHAFVRCGDLARVAIAHSLPLYQWVRVRRLSVRTNPDDGNKFVVIPWREIMRDGVVPFATWDAICWTRTPMEYFAKWPRSRWI